MLYDFTQGSQKILYRADRPDNLRSPGHEHRYRNFARVFPGTAYGYMSYRISGAVIAMIRKTASSKPAPANSVRKFMSFSETMKRHRATMENALFAAEIACNESEGPCPRMECPFDADPVSHRSCKLKSLRESLDLP